MKIYPIEFRYTAIGKENEALLEIDSEVQQYKVNYAGEVRRLGFSRLWNKEKAST